MFSPVFLPDVVRMDMNHGMTASLSVARIHSFEEVDQYKAEWEALDEQQFPRTPFTSPLWMTLWWKHFRRQGIKFRDSCYLHIVQDAEGRLVAVVPLMRSWFPGTIQPSPSYGASFADEKTRMT